ncbi:hypothetical protein RWV98_05745 [Agathobaculum sp. NTUH-O15-33]|uniref:hypothetical protein n=1 Tax=Agathobaculum sp. NTUH-O15-33 TaxID=3079302 RepID=UPI002958462F|nr:hypothetical protein [Agathobaculum sp. NTUH-O15-33]WNX85770.1 hypothetical protein RWV98_05745 [Agathobaculum sp. NTUH-O15-33]
MPKIKYVPKAFRGERLELIQRVNTVISEYEKQGFSLTLRQAYYQMVARAIIPNNERSYKNLGALINDARLAGMIDWNAIEDRTRNLRGNSHWQNPGSIIRSAAWSYHRDHWQGQRYYVEVWVEKDALVGIVGQICERLDVNYFSCRGYVSQSEMWTAARRLRDRQMKQHQSVVLLHLGDHDPSGKDMSRDIVDRLDLFGVLAVDFKRLALNMNQIEQYNPPPNPTKLTDSRASGYIQEFGGECWELDALEPQVISDLIEYNVRRYRNERQYKAIVKQEREEQNMLESVAENWPGIAAHWDEIRAEYC